jgi:hypothetical protein
VIFNAFCTWEPIRFASKCIFSNIENGKSHNCNLNSQQLLPVIDSRRLLFFTGERANEQTKREDILLLNT